MFDIIMVQTKGSVNALMKVFHPLISRLLLKLSILQIKYCLQLINWLFILSPHCKQNVCAFIVSAYSSNWLRLNKPFNPLLGETFEYEIEDQGIKVVFEQVSHHPPVSAWHAESPHFILHGTICPKLRFWGKSIEIKPDGTITLKLKSKPDVYTWKSVNCCIHNIIIGKLWFEQVFNLSFWQILFLSFFSFYVFFYKVG